MCIDALLKQVLSKALIKYKRWRFVIIFSSNCLIMKLTQLLLGLLFLNTSHGAYQPGTPGAPWSEETASIIREKLFQVWRQPNPHL